MNNLTTVQQDNARVLSLLADYLVSRPAFIDADMMQEMSAVTRTGEEAYRLLLSVAMGLDVEENPSDKLLYRGYFPLMVSSVQENTVRHDPYCRLIPFRDCASGAVELTHDTIAPYEAFVRDDFLLTEDGRVIPQIGYFRTECRYPALKSGGRLWMSVTPNEINTMKEPVAHATGHVLTFGLGLGYYALLASEKEDVLSVTCVERDADVIALFETAILPHFPHREKIHVVREDAFSFAERELPSDRYDAVFTDLWHDVGDGLPLYERMLALAPLAPRARHDYWIEKTLKCYLGNHFAE